MEFSRPEYWSGWPFLSPGDLPNLAIKPRSPTLQVDSLSAEPQGKPKNTEVGNLSHLQWIFPTQESNWTPLPMQKTYEMWVGKIPWRRAWQPTSVFLPGQSQGQRSLAGYNP